MLPLQQAYEVKAAIEEYLKATFSFKDVAVQEAFYRFINDPEEGLFKGPYISLKLPFETAPAAGEIPLEIAPDFPPYLHQYKSFHRLTTEGGKQPQPTLITTGTSSGKTESFLYPLLDYCYRNSNRPGIKAIILYPMNALATDQAKRLAKIIWDDPRLKGQVTAGLFIGEGSKRAGGRSYKPDMGPDHIIEARRNIVESPPDILLTNFKMLDYGLMKGEFDTLWNFNYKDPDLLRFLVLDELHTYDGAQGTDVANLVRRLKLKLNVAPGQLCPVGTSATIGNTPDAAKDLVKYASRVFGETITPDAVLTENRLSLEAFLPEPPGGFINSWPHPNAIARSRIGAHESFENYLSKQKTLWQLDPQCKDLELAHELKSLQVIKDLLSITEKGIILLDDLKRELSRINPSFAGLPEWDAVHKYNPREQVLQSLLALLSSAKAQAGQRLVPMLYMQVQLWVREFTGVLRKTTSQPAFAWNGTLKADDSSKALPAYQCRECGSSGWLAVRRDDQPDVLETDVSKVYRHYFDYHKNLYFLNSHDHEAIEEFKPTDTLGRNCYLDPETLRLFDRQEKDRFPVVGYRVLQAANNNLARHICPECNSEESISIIGTRVATLSSIAVSQVLSSDLDPRQDQERKILAFTNSVQDAAHQAGFVEARNYRFTFRSSLQQVLNRAGGTLSLPDLQQQFIAYWKEHADTTGHKEIEAYVYRFFPSDYKGKVNLASDYRDSVTRQFKPFFIQELDTRLSWEVVSEYGYNAQVGRTLEKTGASAVHFDTEMIDAVFPEMASWLQSNNLEMISADDCRHYIHGLLQRMRVRGGVDHPFLDKYRSVALRRWDLNWNKDSRHFLNRYFGKRTRMPRMLVSMSRPPESVDTTYSQSLNWFVAYFRKSFPLAPGNNLALINEFHEQLLKTMKTVGLLNEHSAGETVNYAIRPEVMTVSNQVQLYQCNKCNSQLQTTAHNDLASGTACLDYQCSGKYIVRTANQLNYYQQVYNRIRSPRIYAWEHTGMLPRNLREEVEYSFKERPAFNSLNALVATSTLEMGIDIGTLNAVINNSVPPATANFLQRVGRAGRSSGTALVTNFAAGQNHDLFHFAEPTEMMEGEIGTPGCFLEAKEILRRHFFAFCLDCWAKSDPLNNRFPNRISFMSLLSSDLNDSSFVISRLLSFIKANEFAFVQRFREIYLPDNLSDEVFQPLIESLRSEDWYRNIRQVFESLKQELLYLVQKGYEIEALIKEKRLAPSDAEYAELKAEIRALAGIKKVIQKRSPVEHLTNRGFLPNYAFPETGVKLQASIRAFSAKGSEAPPVHEEFEIVRDASTALKELAPANDFYSLGYKFHISGINTYDWKEPGVLITKRFCSNCDNLQDEALATGNACPKCGDASWGAESNKHKFVKLTAVKSSNKREDATLDDSSEERKDAYYRKTRHLRFDAATSCGAWGVKQIPFGIEYVKHVTCTEVNLGESNVMHSNRIKINQEENVPRHGFITCHHCGKTAVRAGDAGPEDGHYAYCKYKDNGYTGEANEHIFEEVFLYREVETEALKILLPVQEFESSEVLELFKAGLEAGLRLFYKGNPGHIGMWDYREFNRRSQRFDRYLVLFDSIPGGTGYLEKLFDKDRFSELLQAAYLHLKNCSCQHQGKTGCYRCIFTYRNQFVQDGLSRAKAEDLFEKIVSRLSDWEPFGDGLGSLSGNGQIEESELEDRFIRSLKNKAKLVEGWSWEERRDGAMRYFLTISRSDLQLTWQITPQVNLGTAQGIAYGTRADFLMTLVSIKKDGVEDHEFQYDATPFWAIYLDGYAYHAQADNMRFYSDVAKRNAITQSGRYRSWTLTWKDLDLFDATLAATPAREFDTLWFDQGRFKRSIDFYRRGPFQAYFSDLQQARCSMDRLLWFLVNPCTDDHTGKKSALLLAMMQESPGHPSFNADQVEEVLFSPIPGEMRASNARDFYVVPAASLDTSFARLNIAVHVQQLKIVGALELKKIDQDLPKDQWEQFWQTYNLVQLGLSAPVEKEETKPDGVTGLSVILKYYDERLHHIVRQLLQAGLYVNPDGGFFLEEPGFEPAEAALGTKAKKLFIDPVSEDDRQQFVAAGYTEVIPDNFNLSQWK